MKTEITSNSLQELIIKKAENRAWKFVSELIKNIKESGLLEVRGFTVRKGDYERSLEDIFYLTTSSEDNPFSVLYFKKVKQFTDEETKAFVSKVESLVEQADNLLNISENFNY